MDLAGKNMSDILKMLENNPELRKTLNTLLATAKDSEGAGNAGTTAGSSSPASTAHSDLVAVPRKTRAKVLKKARKAMPISPNLCLSQEIPS